VAAPSITCQEKTVELTPNRIRTGIALLATALIMFFVLVNDMHGYSHTTRGTAEFATGLMAMIFGIERLIPIGLPEGI
jgi:uncharacterized protein YhhL (DUF1145 family)